MIQIPSNYFFIANLNLVCNAKCHYCIQKFDVDRTGYSKSSHLTTEQWVDGLNKFDGKLITLSGGEISLRSDLSEIVNGIENFDKIHLGTNLLLHPENYIPQIKDKNIEIGYSYHSDVMNNIDALERLSYLTEHDVSVSISIVDCEPGAEDIAKLFRAYGYRTVVNPFQGWKDGKITPASMQEASGAKYTTGTFCNTSIIAIAPNGSIYPCAHLTYINSSINYGNIKTIKNMEFKKLFCNEYGHCNPCVVGRMDVQKN